MTENPEPSLSIEQFLDDLFACAKGKSAEECDLSCFQKVTQHCVDIRLKTLTALSPDQLEESKKQTDGCINEIESLQDKRLDSAKSEFECLLKMITALQAFRKAPRENLAQCLGNSAPCIAMTTEECAAFEKLVQRECRIDDAENNSPKKEVRDDGPLCEGDIPFGGEVE